VTTELFLQVFQGLSYLLLLVVLAFLWSRVARRAVPRPFWLLLALAWTLNLGGTLAWIVHDLVTGGPLETFSVVDLFYVSRYLLLGLALWRFSAPLPGRAVVGSFLAGLTVFALLGALYRFAPFLVTKTGDWVDFFGYALYPILDVSLVTLAALRLRVEWRSTWARPSGLFFGAMLCYGLANTLNFVEYALFPISGGLLPGLFWTLTDVCILLLAWLGSPQSEDREAR
jgi:hypothetical protein